VSQLFLKPSAVEHFSARLKKRTQDDIDFTSDTKVTTDFATLCVCVFVV
jgi:hypothetical protein